ncbi:hypothetical protein [Flavobacterium sp. 3HN19-14]|uniref:hypothetical protein n=1 Tax=Flavobacterium sp. 3HN19-14 TaxID=3448133 RepID=UPI003EE07096
MLQPATKVAVQDNKSRDLILGLIFDAMGYLSFTIPILGEFEDVIWAPVSAILMVIMYKGPSGKIMGAFDFVEEILPFTDIIPSFTLMWFYKYVIKKQD